MLNSNLKYPHPLLRVEPEDFNTAFFTDDIDILRENEGFRICPRFAVNNEQISKLIEQNKISYAIQIQCSSTYYRTIEYIKNNNDVFLMGGLVHDNVEICPCIIALEDIIPYEIEDSVEAFHLSQIGVYSGDVVGIGTTRRFKAYYKADEVKNVSSIITVNAQDDLERVSVDLNKPNIIVSLPRKQYDLYMDMGSSTTEQRTMLTGLLYVPAITQAISVMEEDSGYEEYAWYKSLDAALERISGGDQEKKEEMIERAFETAQWLVGDNVSMTLQIMKNREW